MHQTIKNLNSIKKELELIDHKVPSIIAVSKTFSISNILPLIEHGHIHFGENKVQEATAKWSDHKKENHNLRLHMIGKLQSNKAKDAVKLFDYIHSVDNQKLADALSKHQLNLNKKINVRRSLQKYR